MKRLVALVLIALIGSSCKKRTGVAETLGEFTPEAPPTTTFTPPPLTPFLDTIKPRSYYPVYPGSWWKYLENNTAIITDRASDSYVLYKYANGQGVASGTMFTFDSSYVPLYNNRPVYGYNRLSDNSIPGWWYFDKYTFLTETPGPAKYIYGKYYHCDNRYQYSSCPEDEITFISKTVDSHGDSIIIATGTYINSRPQLGGGNPNKKTVRIYTKNVGLTFYCYVDTLLHDTIEKRQLLEYHIGTH